MDNSERAIMTAFLILVFIGVAFGIQLFTHDKVTITIQDKYNYVEVSGGGDDDPVHTSMHFLVTDTEERIWEVGYPLWMPFNSAQTLWAKIRVGETYTLQSFGIRVDRLGFYQNVYVHKEMID